MIYAAASRGDSMFVIEIGEVELSFGSTREPKRLGPGQFFGELALIIGDHTRSATATALMEVSLRIVDQRAFESLLERAPDASVELLRRTCAYLLESEQQLVTSLVRRNRELEQTLDYLRRTREDLDATQLMTLTDELTGLYNRRCLVHQSESFLRQALQLATRPPPGHRHRPFQGGQRHPRSPGRRRGPAIVRRRPTAEPPPDRPPLPGRR